MGWLWCARPYNEIPLWASEMLTGRQTAPGFSCKQKSLEGGLQNAGHDLERVGGCALQPEGKPGGPEVAPALRAGTKISRELPWSLGLACIWCKMCVFGGGAGSGTRGLMESVRRSTTELCPQR